MVQLVEIATINIVYQSRNFCFLGGEAQASVEIGGGAGVGEAENFELHITRDTI